MSWSPIKRTLLNTPIQLIRQLEAASIYHSSRRASGSSPAGSCSPSASTPGLQQPCPTVQCSSWAAGGPVWRRPAWARIPGRRLAERSYAACGWERLGTRARRSWVRAWQSGPCLRSFPRWAAAGCAWPRWGTWALWDGCSSSCRRARWSRWSSSPWCSMIGKINRKIMQVLVIFIILKLPFLLLFIAGL